VTMIAKDLAPPVTPILRWSDRLLGPVGSRSSSGGPAGQ
jgi:hypothetical protein